MKKIIWLVLLLFSFMLPVKAEDVGNIPCIANNSCILLCSYKNNFNGIIRNINIVYQYNGNWLVTYDGGKKGLLYKEKAGSFTKVFSDDGSPDIFWEVGYNQDNFQCPKFGYFDRNMRVELCFDDDGTTCEDKISDKIWFSTKFGTYDKDFKAGSEKLDYNVYDQFYTYFNSENSVLGDISCDDIATGKFDAADNEAIRSDMEKDIITNFLNNNKAPEFMKKYLQDNNFKSLIANAANKKKEQCNKENDEMHANGQVSDDEYQERQDNINKIDPDNFEDAAEDVIESMPVEDMQEEMGEASNVTLPNTVSGIDLCSQNGVKHVLHVVGYLLFAAKIAVPLLLVVMGTMDFAKALTDSDDKGTKDALAKLIKRIIAGVIIFFIPTIFNFTFSLIDDVVNNQSKFTQCSDCLFTPFSGNCAYRKLGQ